MVVSLFLFPSLSPFSSRVKDAISFNFPAMRMKHGALRGFEGANAANRYATSNSVSASESKQNNPEKGAVGEKEQREGKRKALYSCWRKKTFRIRENDGTGRCTQIRARSHRGEASAQKRREGVRRMRNFPRISRINEKCQIFRHGGAERVRYSPAYISFISPCRLTRRRCREKKR